MPSTDQPISPKVRAVTDELAAMFGANRIVLLAILRTLDSGRPGSARQVAAEIRVEPARGTTGPVTTEALGPYLRFLDALGGVGAEGGADAPVQPSGTDAPGA